MPSQSTIVRTMDMVVGEVGALQLQLPPTTGQPPGPVKVVRRIYPRRQVKLDPLNQITVWRTDQPERIIYAAFGKQWVEFLIYVTLILPMNQDLESNLDLLSMWRQNIIKLFEIDGPNAAKIAAPPIFGVTNLFEVRVKPDVMLPRQEAAIEYSYVTIGLQFRAQGA